jgi:hypothetical protein
MDDPDKEDQQSLVLDAGNYPVVIDGAFPQLAKPGTGGCLSEVSGKADLLQKLTK